MNPFDFWYLFFCSLRIELERKQAEQMEAARAAKTIDFNKDFRIGLDVQRAEIEAQKLVEKEKFESELALRRSLEAALKDQVCICIL